MKKFKLLAIIVLTIGIVAFHSCKKDDELTNNNETETSTFNPYNIENMDEYLTDFMKKIKSPTRNPETMSVDDAEWHISACLNFMYCNANVARTHVVYDTITTTINTSDGSVTLSDINTSIQQIFTEVSYVYNASNVENKNLMFIQSVIEDDVNRSGNIVRTVVGISGIGGDYYYFQGGPFYPEWWELYELFTQPYYHWSNEAPDTLEYYINMYIPDADTISNGRIYYTFLRDVEFTNFTNPDRVFYCGNCSFNYQLDCEEMRYYLDSYLGLINENRMYPSEVKAVSRVEPITAESGSPRPIYHKLFVKYGIPTSTEIEIQ